MVVIYGLTNKKTSKVYIGCTKDAHKRYREHRCLLRNGKHAEPDLQSDWVAHGEQSFELHVLETLPHNTSVAVKRERELWWMDVLAGEGRLYNRYRHSFQLSPEARKLGAANAHKVAGQRWTKEANEKRSLSQVGKPKGHGAKISATKRANRLRQADEIV